MKVFTSPNQILLVSDIGLMTNGEGCNNILKLSFENVYKKDILKEINWQVMCATPDNIMPSFFFYISFVWTYLRMLPVTFFSTCRSME